MAIERSWEAVGPIAFTANGGADGTITLSSVAGFKVKQSVAISALTQPDLKLEVKKIISPTKLIVGPVVTTGKLLARQDLSLYTTANLASIRAEEQKKAVLPINDIIQAVYRQEPGTTIGVEIDDQFGNPIDSVKDSKGVNRLAVDGQFTAAVDVQVDVDIDGYYDATTNPDPDNIGLIGHTRSLATDETKQKERLTAIRGSTNTDTVSADVALHDDKGNALSYNAGASDATTLRSAANIKKEGVDLDYNFGVASDLSLRIAALIGNATGSANFNAGITGTQTLRTSSNITRNGTELSYNSGASDANTLRGSVNIKKEGAELDYNFGAPSALSLRIAALVGNSTGVADFNAGATGAQTLRTVSNLQRNGNELSYGVGASDANTLRTLSLLANATGTLAYGYGVVDVQTLRTASQIGNATGAADFNAGVSGTQTLRTSSNITRNGTELSYNAGISDANTLRSSVNIKKEGAELDYNFGAASALSLRIAALIGNATGSADFNSGITGLQTLRTSSNITRNGTELSYNAGASDANTLRGSVNIKKEGVELDYNFGAASALSLRIAALIGNATGSADFNSGITGAQTLRTSSNITRNGTELSYNAGTSDANTLRSSVNIKKEGVELDYNFGAASSTSLRVAALLGNATGASDFNEGANSAQTLRVSANIARNGNELSYNSGTSDANTLRASVNLKKEGSELDYNFGAASALTLRTATLMGNANGSADFNAGITGAQTLRTSSNITRNGTELSYNIGTPDANTLRIAAILANATGQVDYNHGAVGAQTQRVAAVISNETAKADFNAGATGANTLRTTANITRNGNELSYNDGASDANTQRVSSNTKFDGTTPTRNAGATDANTQRVAANTYDGLGNPITSHNTAGSQRGLDVAIVDGPQIDSYNRLRVVNQDLVFGVHFANNVNSLLFNTSTVGSATLTSVTNQAAARLSTTTGATDSLIVQTKRYLRYTPGISHQIMITGIIGAKKTNVRQRWGLFDANDGLFFEQTGTDLAVVLRSSTSGSPVDTRVVQANWNLDKLDGTGTSGVNLDTSKHNVYVIDYVWQGGGRIRYGIMFGQGVIYFHQTLNANVNTAPFMRSPSRPGRVELTNLGVTASPTNMDIVCVFALRETSDKLIPSFAASASRGINSVSVSTIKPLITLRPKATFNGITNRVPIAPQKATVITAAQSVLIQVYLNATLTGASFTSAGTNSAAEYDISATTVTGGTLILETYIDNTGNGELNLAELSDNSILGLDIVGSIQDSITITGTSLAGGTNTWAQIAWQEFQ